MKLNKITSGERADLDKRLSYVKLFIKHPDQIVYRFGKQSLLLPENEEISYFAKKHKMVSLNDILYKSDSELKKNFKLTNKSLAKLKDCLYEKLDSVKYTKNPLLRIKLEKIKLITKYYGQRDIGMLPIKKGSAKLLKKTESIRCRKYFTSLIDKWIF